MSIFLFNKSIIRTIGNIPTKSSLYMPENLIDLVTNEVASSSNTHSTINLSEYNNKTLKSRQTASCIRKLAAISSIILAIIIGIMASFGKFLPIATPCLLGCISVFIITRMIMAVKNIKQLNACKKDFLQVITKLSVLYCTSNNEIKLDVKPRHKAAKSAYNIINSQKRLHQFSIAAASITMIAIIGLAIAFGFVLASVYTGSSIGLTPLVRGFSATHLLLMTSGSLLGLGLLLHVVLAIKSLKRSWSKTDTVSQLEKTIIELADLNSISVDNISCTKKN